MKKHMKLIDSEEIPNNKQEKYKNKYLITLDFSWLPCGWIHMIYDVPQGCSADLRQDYIKKELQDFIFDFYGDTLLSYNIAEIKDSNELNDIIKSYNTSIEDYHEIIVEAYNLSDFEEHLKIFIPKNEPSYEAFDSYITETLNNIFNRWTMYVDLYMKKPMDLVLVKGNDINIDNSYGSFLIQDKINGDFCWIDAYWNKENGTGFDFNQYVFINNQADIDAQRFQEKIKSSESAYSDICCLIEQHIQSIEETLNKNNDEIDI